MLKSQRILLHTVRVGALAGLFPPPVLLKDTVPILIILSFGSCRFLRGERETVLRLSSRAWLVHASQGLENNQKINASNCINVSYHVVPRPSSDCQSRFCCPKMSSRSRRNLRSNLATIHLWRSVLEVESCAWRLVCYPRQTASESRPARRRGRADKGFPIFSC